MKKHITYCNQCDNCKVYPDPDFDDWFCHDDIKIVCNVNNMTMASACRPYEINSFKVPKNCPLMNKMEEYFKSVGCEYVIVDVFAYNDIGKNFYNKKDYRERMKTMIKKI